MNLEEALQQMQGNASGAAPKGNPLGVAQDMWDKMSLLDKAALVSSPIPVLGQGLGLGADLRNMYDNPEERTWGNVALAATNFIPGKRAYDAAKKGGGAVRQIMAGEKAATADKTALEAWRAMISRGVDPERAHKTTGWFQPGAGKPNAVVGAADTRKPRFEIDDSGAEINAMGDITGRIAMGNQQYLPDILKHEKLYEAYPQLRQMRVNFEDLPPGVIAQHSKSRGINIGRNTMADYDEGVIGDRDLLQTLLHEVQHGVQNIEGFAPGGNARSILDSMRFSPQWKHAAPQAQQAEATKRYFNLPGERESRAVENRAGMTMEERLANMPRY